jgi:hypothetical protein
LQKLFGVVEKLIGLLGVHTEGPRSKLGRNRCLRDGRVGRHKADLVDVDVRIALQGSLQLFGELHGLRTGARRETAHEARQAGLRYFGREVNAGDAGSGEHAREALFRRRRFERRAVEQELVSRNSQ